MLSLLILPVFILYRLTLKGELEHYLHGEHRGASCVHIELLGSIVAIHQSEKTRNIRFRGSVSSFSTLCLSIIADNRTGTVLF
ncbi:hypothetical protein BJ875DRAFT_453834 [Amylocarpus encephaloides]|uniref:Secreted protein n=1 Tax=Amylocarpus encephaloides TaxID=45428 RepID=A0A9P7YPL4_9HELO|nr:hypothetical protein BJ875DRAFT_453834 [Amylocarpus encephaloides]